MKAQDVARTIEALSPKPLEGDEYGLIYGNPDQDAKKVGIIWRLSKNIFKKIIDDRVDLLIVHESVFLKEEESKWSFDIKSYAESYNKSLKTMIEEAKIVIYRYHSNFDMWSEIGMLDAFAKSLGLVREVNRGKFTRTYEVNPMSVENVAKIITDRFPWCPIRIFGEQSRIVSKISTMIGGLGGNQLLMPYEVNDQGGEVIILGDMIEYVLLTALELGMAVIETLHSVTEEPALKNIKTFLREKMPGTEIIFYESGAYLY